MSRDRIAFGKTGEALAVDFLKQNGYILVCQNYRTRFAEIDIIARDGDTLCFIEVKARTRKDKALPRQAVTVAKQRKIITAAAWYLKENNLHDQRSRFDVMEMVLNNGRWQMNLIPNAFQADGP